MSAHVIRKMKMKSVYTSLLLTLTLLVAACSDDDSFTTSSSARLTFSTDTVKLDTTFSNVPTASKSLWVYNRSGDGLRCTSVRLERGGITGFRVNVDGEYLGPSTDYGVSDIEVRKNDSIRVYVELTSATTGQPDPVALEDNLVFTLESGVEQRVNLSAWSWDALLERDIRIARDSTIGSSQPIVVYGGIQVAEGATLTIAAGTTLYFHNDAGIDVAGTLHTEGTAENNVVLRGDRIDHMFDYLPYDYVSGQWQGLHFRSSSYDNALAYTDIHSTYNGIEIDSSDVTRTKLTMNACTVHNCQGFGIQSRHANIYLANCQLTNTLGDCLALYGGTATVNNCTLAQFYPFDYERGVAIRFSAEGSPMTVDCRNTLITGYADDELMGEPGDGTHELNFLFDHCIIRTPKVTTDDSLYFTHVTYENVEDTVTMGRKNFRKLDTENLRYDFRLSDVSPAIGSADPSTALPADRNGRTRGEQPDIGCYAYVKE